MSDTESPLRTPRGDTIIAPDAIVRLAAHAAGVVDGVEAVTRSGVGRLLRRARGRDQTSVGASTDEGRGTVELDFTVTARWPEPAAELGDRLRRHVGARVQQMTGLRVTRFDIDVAGFGERPPPKPPRVV